MLVIRIARNHPLPDGNKRLAWQSLTIFLALNGHRLEVGTKVALRIVFPSEEPVTVAGRVQSRRTGPLRGFGIEFLYASEEQREHLAQRIVLLVGT